MIGFIAGFAAVFIYAALFVAARLGIADGLDGFDQTAIRFGASAILIAPMIMRGGREALARLGWARLAAVTVLGGAPYSVVFLSGLQFAPVSYGAAIVPGVQPIAVLILSVWAFSEKPNRWTVIGSIVCLAGLVAMILDQTTTSSLGVLFGVAIFLLAAIMWGSYAVAVRKWQVKPMDMLVASLPLSAVSYLPIYFALSGERIFAAKPETLLIQVIVQGIGVGLVASFLYAFAIQRIGSAKTSAMSPLIPTMATVMAFTLLGETPTTLQWTGVALVTAGLLLRQAGSLKR
jgi:drug/metabolite transporter (DMT)-like permease